MNLTNDINWCLNGERASADTVNRPLENLVNSGTIGRLSSPYFDLPLRNNLSIIRGSGTVDFSRASTASFVNIYGELKYAAQDEPRFEKQGLLIEGESTNLMLNSNYMNTPSVLADGTAYTLDVGTLSNGVDNYHTLTFINDTTSRIYEPMTLPGAGYYTISALLWCSSGTETIRLGGFDNSNYILSNDITIDSTPRFYSFTFETTNTGQQYVSIHNSLDASVKTINWCNVQVEEKPFRTSYIPTTATTETRAADIVSISPENALTSGIGLTVHMEVSSEVNENGLDNHAILKMSDSTSNEEYNRVLGYHKYTTPSEVKEFMTSYGSYSAATNAASIDNDTYSYTFSIDVPSAGNCKLFHNGELVNTTTNLDNLVKTPDTFDLGNNNESEYLFGHIKNIKIYDEVLTETDIALLGGRNGN